MPPHDLIQFRPAEKATNVRSYRGDIEEECMQNSRASTHGRDKNHSPW